MITLKKLCDKEYYFRKWIFILSFFLSDKHISAINFHHKVKQAYRFTFGKKLHLHKPKNFNEKLIWISLFWDHPIKAVCADKFKVRSYLTEECKIPKDLLIPIIGKWDKTEDIDFSSLPSQFVLKCNHGCGYNIIVQDKSTIDRVKICQDLNQWISQPYHGGITEIHYQKIWPRYIICEKLLPTLNNRSVVDYKIHCFNGKPTFILLCYDRDQNEVAKLATFDFNWNQLYYVCNETKTDIPVPCSLPQMISYATTISKHFPFVRVDFYDVLGKPLIGELTFTPYGNMVDYYKPKVLNELGNKLSLPHKYKA